MASTQPRAAGGSQLRQAMNAFRREAVLLGRLAFVLGVIGALLVFALVFGRTAGIVLALPARSEMTVLGLIMALAICAALHVCIQHLRESILISLGERLENRLGVPMLIAASEIRGTMEQNAGQALQDLDEVSRWMTGSLAMVALELVMLPIYLLLLLAIHWAFSAMALAAACIAGLISLAVHRASYQRMQQAQGAEVRAIGAMADAVNHAEMVAALGMQRNLLRRWSGMALAEHVPLRLARQALRYGDAALDFMQLLLRGGVVALSIVMSDHGAELGYLMVGAMMLVPHVTMPFARLGARMEAWARGRAAWARLNALADAPPVRPSPGDRFPCPEGRLSIEQLTVFVPGVSRPVLRDVTISVPPGDVVCIAGPVGSGKSTLLRAIMGFQRPTAGDCYLDGHATWQWDRTDLARHIGLLPQDPGLSEGTIAEAIARLEEPDMAQVIAAAQRVGAHDFIVQLPAGYATPLSDQILSAGQRQRIGLARAIYGGPRVVLLDEPSAWLDRKGEAELIRLFAWLKARGTSVVFTSHRPSLVAAADEVLSIRGGALANAGNRRPAALAAARGRLA